MVLCIANQKGGVGKTSTAQNMGAGLSRKGFHVLLIDSDPQTNLTYSCGIEPRQNGCTTLYDVYEGDATASQAVVNINDRMMSLLIGDARLVTADKAYIETGREYILREALTPITEKFDFIIIDAPPTLGILTVNALTAADRLIVPISPGIYSLQGLAKLHETVNAVRRFCNKQLTVDGILLTRTRPNTALSRDTREAAEALAVKMGTRLYKSEIRESVAVNEAQSARSDLFQASPRASVTKCYADFIKEFLSEKGI